MPAGHKKKLVRSKSQNMSTLFFGNTSSALITLPDENKKTDPHAYRVKSLKQCYDGKKCYFLLSFHTTKTAEEVYSYLADVAGLVNFVIYGCDS